MSFSGWLPWLLPRCCLSDGWGHDPCLWTSAIFLCTASFHLCKPTAAKFPSFLFLILEGTVKVSHDAVLLHVFVVLISLWCHTHDMFFQEHPSRAEIIKLFRMSCQLWSGAFDKSLLFEAEQPAELGHNSCMFRILLYLRILISNSLILSLKRLLWPGHPSVWLNWPWMHCSACPKMRVCGRSLFKFCVQNTQKRMTPSEKSLHIHCIHNNSCHSEFNGWLLKQTFWLKWAPFLFWFCWVVPKLNFKWITHVLCWQNSTWQIIFSHVSVLLYHVH